MAAATVVVPGSTGHALTECPRHHDGRLWFVDMHLGRVLALDPHGGGTEVIAELPGPAGGLGWLPDGTLLVVQQDAARVLRRDEHGWAVHADLSEVARGPLNDLWVDRAGRAYVGEMGFDVHRHLADPAVLAAVAADPVAGPLPVPSAGRLFLVEPGGQHRVVASDLLFGNGIVVNEQTRTLYVAETFGARLAVFDIAADGSLGNRREWPLGFCPDGIALEPGGAVWIADPIHQLARRFAGGIETGAVPAGQLCLACAVSEDGRTLFLCTSPTLDPAQSPKLLGARIEVATLPAPDEEGTEHPA
jgi:sugar lactone lactonase YvrE